VGEERLFVYGTLRPAALSHAPTHIQAAMQTSARFVGAGSVAGALHMVSWYPGLIEAGDGRVIGDVYALDATLLNALDVYEGAEYARSLIKVSLDDGRDLEAWTYFYVDAPRLGARIESGDFLSETAPP
jgi:gamma-glutamylaminecyclotransferase